MAQKPSIPKGTRDFTPQEAARRNYLFDTIRRVFKQFGYAPIETPAMENLSTLLGKYGEEGDKLLFKVLNSGDCFSGINIKEGEECNSNALSMKVCEKGLRYDLTVPFARFVVQHQNELTFPFKRYQLQPVWRADRPQKGRYREFYQCDADVIGTDSLLCELELVQMVDRVFSQLGVRVCIHINNRKVLAGLAQVLDCPDRITDLTVSMDKLDKTSIESVLEELQQKGFDAKATAKLEPLLRFEGNSREKIALLRTMFSDADARDSHSEEANADAPRGSEIGLKGTDELETLFSLIDNAGIGQEVVLDLSLARGLNYYTGAIFEVKALDTPMGSICGGGRYDNLTGIFGLAGMSGVGISFGADRIYDVLLALDGFPTAVMDGPAVVFFNLGMAEAAFAQKCMNALRDEDISCEIYPDAAKMKKQFDYAQKRGCRFAAIIGESEVSQERISLKDLESSQQESLSIQEMVEKLKAYKILN